MDRNPQLDTCDWSMYSNILKLIQNLQRIPFKTMYNMSMLRYRLSNECFFFFGGGGGGAP